MALTDAFVKYTKPTGKPAGDKYRDGGGYVSADKHKWQILAYGLPILRKAQEAGVRRLTPAMADHCHQYANGHPFNDRPLSNC